MLKKKKTPANNATASRITTTPTALVVPDAADRYGFVCTCGEHVQAVAVATLKQIDALSNALMTAVHGHKKYTGIVAQLVAAEGNYLTKALRNNFKTISAYTGPDLLAVQLMEYNLFEFAEGKTEARLATIQDHLVDPNTNKIRPYNDFKERATKGVKKYNNTYLRAEYNLSIAVGQTSAQYYRYKAEEDSVTPFVKYQTAGDSNVRSQHQSLNGKIFSLKDNTAMDLWPPNGYGCRCEMVQHLKKANETHTKGSKGKALLDSNGRFKDSQFDLNRANLQQVFTKKQFYSDTKGLSEKLNNRTYDVYGLKPKSTFKDTLKPIKLDNTITADNVAELFTPVKNQSYMGFKDYSDRPMILKKKTFDYHTKGKYIKERRHQLFPHTSEVLKNPDEVWLFEHETGKFKTNYIKFYKDKTLVVKTEVLEPSKALNIETWFEAKGDEKIIRKGVLINKK